MLLKSTCFGSAAAASRNRRIPRNTVVINLASDLASDSYLPFFTAALPAACVLEEVETAIKEKALTLLKESFKVGASAEQRAGFNAIFQLEPLPAAKDIPNLTYHDIHVDLADFFDLISGTAATGMLCAQCCPARVVCHNHLLGHACLHVSEHLRCLERQAYLCKCPTVCRRQAQQEPCGHN
jgi:hypothetical protein